MFGQQYFSLDNTPYKDAIGSWRIAVKFGKQVDVWFRSDQQFPHHETVLSLVFMKFGGQILLIVDLDIRVLDGLYCTQWKKSGNSGTKEFILEAASLTCNFFS
jgi:hypothetical protein